MKNSERGLWILLVTSLALGFVGLGPKEAQVSGNAALGPTGGPVVTEEDGPADPAVDHGDGGRSRRASGPAVLESRYECLAGRNGGRTDRGVTANEIKLATTVVQDGPAASLLRWSPVGMQAVINEVNRTGGICGRRISLTTANDSFRADLGQQYIRNFLEEDYFALPVVPSAEGLGAAILSGDISRAGIPVIGSDGMRVEQYRDARVWPVSTATVSTMRILADYGYQKKKARDFAIVWDSKYKFGQEGAQAFKREVERLGGRIVADASLNPDLNSYASEVQKFNDDCAGGRCDMVALLLLPDTAETWMKSRPEMGVKYTAGAQTLFTEEFAQDCIASLSNVCHGIAVWTGYNPPVASFRGLPGVNKYVNDVRAIAPNAPIANQFMQGAYLGMSVFVRALRDVGAELTRERLRAVMDSLVYRSDLSSALRWEPGNHAANTRARGFSIVYQGGIFQGWRDDATGFIADPLGGP